MGYAAATALLIVIYRNDVPHWRGRVAVHAAMIAGALVVVGRGSRNGSRNGSEDGASAAAGAWGLARLYYPALFFVQGYLEMETLQPLLWGGFRATALLARADVVLFGAHPTVLAQRFYGGWLDELMSFFYLSYYAVPFVVTVPWLRAGRRDLVLQAAGVAALTCVVSFALYFAIPALGPRRMPELQALHQARHAGPVLGRIVRAIEGDAGAVAGGVFPSLHVAATTAWAVTARRAGSRSELPWIGAVGMLPAAVYLGYHHAVDVIAGFLLGAALPWLVPPAKART